jgi:hypothetical protein
MADFEFSEYFDYLIKKYLKKFIVITRKDINNILELRPDLHLIKIINNKLYFSGNYNPNNLLWETRRESLKYLLLKVLEKYSIPDCEFVIIYNDDSINTRNRISEDLPVIVSTSCLESMNYILCPDFTFSFSPEYNYKNYELLCNEIISSASDVPFENKIEKLIWRGTANNTYRTQFLRVNNLYDVRNIEPRVCKLGEESNTFTIANAISRKDKVKYKYHLHLNGHQGNSYDGAYSSAFKWGLAANSLVFYCAPVIFKEFWMDSEYFHEGIHYIYCSSNTNLENKLKYYQEHPLEAKIIAANGYDFFQKYLWKYEGIAYYMYKLLNEYSQRMNYKPTLDTKDTLITDIAYSEYLIS